MPSKSLILGWIISRQWYDRRIAFSEELAAIYTPSPINILSSSFSLFETTYRAGLNIRFAMDRSENSAIRISVKNFPRRRLDIGYISLRDRSLSNLMVLIGKTPGLIAKIRRSNMSRRTSHSQNRPLIVSCSSLGHSLGRKSNCSQKSLFHIECLRCTG
jgi:hypothetical protein